MAGRGRKNKTYSLETKLKVIMAYQGGMNFRAIQAKFQIRHHAQIYCWAKWFRMQQWERLRLKKDRHIQLKPADEQLKTKFVQEIKKRVKFPHRAAKKQFYLHLIRTYRPVLSLNKITQWLRISKNTYYRWVKQATTVTTETPLDQAIKKICVQHQYYNQRGQRFFIWGHRRVYIELLYRQIKVNRKTVYKKMKQFGLLCQTLKNRYLKRRKHTYVPLSGLNLLKNQFQANQPWRKLCADFTTFMYGKRQKLYLAVIMDLYNREIISYHISDQIDTKTILIPVQKLAPLTENCLFHSDQGPQYTSQLCQKNFTSEKIYSEFFGKRATRSKRLSRSFLR
ncbi:MAG: DDE-type integrase/transposase/recombinase [Vigna little leaf phytoplasma]|nr:DDE-type integrase/transposase/recombinase [Vigna little leaf phytoplasma]